MRPLGCALLLFAACATSPVPVDDVAGPTNYSAVQDPAGKAAWERAQQALAIGNHKAALPELHLVVDRCPDFVRGHLALQDAAVALGGEEEARMRAFYRDLGEGRTPVNAYVKARLYDTSYARGEALAGILRRAPSFGWAHLSSGRIRRSQGRLLDAVDEFRAAFLSDDTLVEARLERGEVLTEIGRYEEAAVDYEAYFAARPNDWPSLREYVAMLIYKLFRIDRALELLAHLDRQFPGDAELRMHLGAAKWRARRPREALVHYLAVLADDPGNSRALLDVGLIYYDALPADQSEAERRKWWPRARIGFRLFLARGEPGDGHEAFERAFAVPYRLGVIEELLGPDSDEPVTIDDLRLPPGQEFAPRETNRPGA